MAVIDRAPGPSPWYLRGSAAGIAGFAWKDPGTSAPRAGTTVLVHRKQPMLVLDFYNYVSVIDADTLLVWHQQRDTTGPTAPVVLRLFRASALQPLDPDLDAVCNKMRKVHASYAAAVPPIGESSINTRIVDEHCTLTFPAELHHIDELLMLCRSSGIGSQSPDHSNLALIVARPSEGRYKLYPQDWFNSGGFDYGYEWVTRVVRDPRSGKVHGDGIRIAPFVLNSKLRNLEKEK